MEMKGSDINLLIKNTFQEAIESLTKDYQGSSLSNIYITVDRESGEVAFYDDEENKVADIVVFDWVDNQDLSDNDIISLLREIVGQLDGEEKFSSLELYAPYTISYVDDNFTVIEDILTISDDSEIVVENDLMEKFDREFDEFLDKLLKE